MSTQNKRHVDYYLPAAFPAVLGLTNDENTLHLSIGYSEGGTNYFSGNTERRGITVGVSAVKCENGVTSFVIGGGLMSYGRRYMVAPAARFNAKLLATIDAAIRPQHAEILALALLADYDGIRALLTTACAGIGQPKPKAAKLTTLADAIAESNAANALPPQGSNVPARQTLTQPSPAAWDETAHVRASEA